MPSRRAIFLSPIAILLILFVVASSAADFGNAMKHYQDGDFDAALKEFTALANEGDADAQFVLGDMYASGQGVGKDPVQAYMWYDLAARNGAQGASAVRDDLGEKMSPDDIAKAQRLSREWQPGPASATATPTPLPATTSTTPVAGTDAPSSALDSPAGTSNQDSQGGFFPNLARSVTGLLGGPRPAESTPGTSTATIGIRGLGAEELRAASPDANALQKMESYTASEGDAAGFARNEKLVTQNVSYIDVVSPDSPSPASTAVPFGAR